MIQHERAVNFDFHTGIDTAEVPAIVAGDLNAESLQEVTAVAAAV